MLDGSTANVGELCKNAKLVCFATMASEDTDAVEKIAYLEAMHRKYYPELVVIGTPTNQWIGKEAGTDEEVLQRYQDLGVTFPVTRRENVFLSESCDLYKVLKERDQN